MTRQLLMVNLFLLPAVAFGADGKEANSYAPLFALVPALIPIISNYFFKLIENKNASNRITKELDVNQRRMEFVKRYYEVQREFVDEGELPALKAEVAKQLATIKQETDDVLTDSYWHAQSKKLSAQQRLFLSFKPGNKWGSLWRVLYYLIFVFLLLVFLGFFLTEEGEFSTEMFIQSIQDTSLTIGIFFFVCLMLLFRQFALWNYEEAFKKETKTN